METGVQLELEMEPGTEPGEGSEAEIHSRRCVVS